MVESRERIAWGNGSLDAAVVVVGEAPAAGVEPRSTDHSSGASPRDGDSDADRWRGGNWTGKAYTSRHSGRTVRELFADAGLGPEELYVTNAVKCFPEGEDGSNREPTADERANCRTHLRTEIERIDPAVIATTGKHATLSVLGDDAPESFLDGVLDPVESEDFDAAVLPLVHPSYQNVWLPRLGYDRETYVEAIRARIAARR
ncbi:uracil-DNA glycosylase [Halorussus marinus]|uniref:uracil-DNA glycosylase n=1 Tax=Halorussus marinus TaxID=2505976 RepID=UPI00106E489E|nr:uracil-DNA glycosylase family protein [Halorussus marinus]